MCDGLLRALDITMNYVAAGPDSECIFGAHMAESDDCPTSSTSCTDDSFGQTRYASANPIAQIQRICTVDDLGCTLDMAANPSAV